MDKVFEPDLKFDFAKLSLGHPQTTKGGSYFTKIMFNNQSVYVQFPKCKTKQGIIQTEKNIYTDLLYETTYNNQLNEWLENLESHCRKLLYEKNNLWFSGDIELSDIESAFTNSAKMYKSGKQFLIRCYIPKPQIIKTTASCFVYDESEKPLSLNEIDVSREIIPLVKIDGIKFTNKSFQIELVLTQIMVMNIPDDFKQCLIKSSNLNKPSTQPVIDSEHVLFSGVKMNERNNQTQIGYGNEKTNQNSDVHLDDSTNQNKPFLKEEKQMAVSISFPETKELDLESSNIIDNLYITDASETEDKDNEYDDNREDDTDDEEGYEEDEEDGEDGDDGNEEDKNGEYKVKNDKRETNLVCGVNKSLEKNLVEVNDLEIIDNTDIFNKTRHMKDLLEKSITERSILNRNSVLKINEKNNLNLEELQKEKQNTLELVDLNIETSTDLIKLRNPNEVYYEIYKAAREKAKRARKMATEAYLEAKNIKIKYMLDYLDESDEDEVYQENI